MAEDRKVRVVARHISELLLARGLRWQAAYGLDRLDALLVQVVLSANLAGGGDDPLAMSDDERRPMSLMATAQSMQLPYETVRRRIAALRGKGQLALLPAGSVVLSRAIGEPAMRALAADDTQALLATVRALAAAGHPAAHEAVAGGRDLAAPHRAAPLLLDYAVRAMQGFVALYGGFMAGSITAAVTAANVRHLHVDPDRSRSFATRAQIPPDSERRPVPVRQLARELALPYETVRRHLAALVARDLVDMREGGAVVPTRVIARAAHEEHNSFLLVQFDRLLGALSRNNG